MAIFVVGALFALAWVFAHRQAAADHARKAEEPERCIELQERHAQFHEERAAATQRERERV